MNILMCSYQLPYPLTQGEKLRLINLSRHIAKKNQIYLLVLDRGINPEHLTIVEKMGIFSKIILIGDIIHFNRYKTIVSQILADNWLPQLSSRKVTLEEYKLLEVIDTYKIDLVHVVGYEAGIFFAKLPYENMLIDLVDSFTLRMKRELSDQKTRTASIYIKYRLLKRIEYFILKYSNHITVVSPIDKQCLLKINPRPKIHVIPLGVDISYFQPTSEPEEIDPSVIFFGVMSYSPNIDAALFILNDIYPLLRKEIPNIKLFIVGRDPPESILKYKDENISVTGSVEDIRPYLQRASLALLPMRKGSGMKGKILEALAMGKPVVTTPCGAESFDERIRSFLLISDNKETLKEQVISTLNDKEKIIETRYNLRKIIIRNHSWESIAEQYEKLYLEITHGVDARKNVG